MYPKRLSRCANIAVPAIPWPSWDSQRSDVLRFKRDFREDMYAVQQSRCAYCGISILPGSGAHIEHFAYKDKYPEWIFELKNLVLSCPHCNASCKRTYDTIISPVQAVYQENHYSIVHPLFDDFYDFIEWVPGTYPRPKGGLTANDLRKAQETIEIFNLSEDYRVNMHCVINSSPELQCIAEYLP